MCWPVKAWPTKAWSGVTPGFSVGGIGGLGAAWGGALPQPTFAPPEPGGDMSVRLHSRDVCVGGGAALSSSESTGKMSFL